MRIKGYEVLMNFSKMQIKTKDYKLYKKNIRPGPELWMFCSSQEIFLLC